LTRQAMQLGWLPGVDIRQTSDNLYGQIFVPVVNGLMMVATLGITIGFGSSARLAGAYGVAVSATMMLTTVLLLVAMLRVWRWPAWAAIPLAALFLAIDVAFFGANLLKIADGGWLPLGLGAAIFFVMVTWRAGADAVHDAYVARHQPVDAFLAHLTEAKIPRVPGVAVFLTRAEDAIPSLMVDYVASVGALHRNVIILTVIFEATPRADEDARCGVARLADGLWRVTLRFGFLEIPNLATALAGVKDLECAAEVKDAIYFGSRDLVVGKRGGRLRGVRLNLFVWLFRNAVKSVDRFRLPPDRVIEVARQIEV